MSVSPEREAAIREAHEWYRGEDGLCNRDGFLAVEWLLGALDGTRVGADILRAELDAERATAPAPSGLAWRDRAGYGDRPNIRFDVQVGPSWMRVQSLNLARDWWTLRFWPEGIGAADSLTLDAKTADEAKSEAERRLRAWSGEIVAALGDGDGGREAFPATAPDPTRLAHARTQLRQVQGQDPDLTDVAMALRWLISEVSQCGRAAFPAPAPEDHPGRCRSVRAKGRCELAEGHEEWHTTRGRDYVWANYTLKTEADDAPR